MNAYDIIIDAQKKFDRGVITTSEFIEIVSPTKNVKPIKHGYWLKDEEGDYHCSECKAIVEADEKTRHYWAYCYHCGALMIATKEESR